MLATPGRRRRRAGRALERPGDRRRAGRRASCSGPTPASSCAARRRPGSATDFSFRATTDRSRRSAADPTSSRSSSSRPRRSTVDGELVFDGGGGPASWARRCSAWRASSGSTRSSSSPGVPIELVVEQRSRGPSFLSAGQGRAATGGRSRDPIEAAAAAAADADVAVVLVGTSDEWESEGHDRASMDLPGDQDELVRRVAAANPRTVVLVNAGAPVTMPWVDDVAAVVQVWLGGQEMASAVDAVLFGEAEPAGRLPTTVPLRLEHNPTLRQLPRGERPPPLRRGAARRLPLVRHPPPARAVPLRPRRQLHHLRLGRGAASSDGALPAGGTVTVTVPVTNTGRPARRRGRAVLRRAARRRTAPAGPGAGRLRQGVARPGRDGDRRDRARRARLRPLGPARRHAASTTGSPVRS